VRQAAREGDERATAQRTGQVGERACHHVVGELDELIAGTVRSLSRVASRAPAGAPRAIAGAAAVAARGWRAKNASSSDNHRRVLRGYFFLFPLLIKRWGPY
jgi:hypothetical protein